MSQNFYPNRQTLFVGPAPSSGYNYCLYSDGSGNEDDTGESLYSNHNLLQPIEHLSSISWDISSRRTDIQELSNKSLKDRVFIQKPIGTLNFSYMLNGLKNDLRNGFEANYERWDYPNIGTLLYGESGVSPITGFDTNESGLRDYDPYHPNLYRDKRNIFFVNNSLNRDILKHTYTGDDHTIRNLIDENYANYDVIGFGNCYINTYSTSCSIGNPASSSVSYIFENLKFYDGGSGYSAPSLDPETYSGNGKKFAIPPVYSYPTMLPVTPNDIKTTLTLSDIGVAFSDLSVQGYNINLELNRINLESIGYDLPLDRKLNFPVLCDLTFDAIVHDFQTGDLLGFVDENKDYDINIRLYNPTPRNNSDISIRYDFRKAKLTEYGFNGSFGNSTSVRFSFSTELVPNDLTKGFFISGQLNEYADEREDYLVDEDFNFLVDENGDKIITNYRPMY